eukprot:PLAT9226.1.p1 GENE.PLAT9226.1~~PLAT9226.1.p1  ORF type:complete len:296 (+),score=101.23 PLAT9226.1:29-916(+)
MERRSSRERLRAAAAAPVDGEQESKEDPPVLATTVPASSMDDEGWTTVGARGAPRKQVKRAKREDSDDPRDIRVAVRNLKRRLKRERQMVRRLGFVEGLAAAIAPFQPTAVVCLGLGSVCTARNPCVQLAVLVEWCASIALPLSSVRVFDPLFTAGDEAALRALGCTVLEDNLRGCYDVADQATLFYMPFCPFMLYENLLRTNWAADLSNIAVLGNGVADMLDGLHGAKTCMQLLLPAMAERDVMPPSSKVHSETGMAFYGQTVYTLPSAALAKLELPARPPNSAKISRLKKFLV